jgi:hypothetical protein
MGFWIFCAHLFRQYSRKEDLVGGLENYKKTYALSAGFTVVFGFTF